MEPQEVAGFFALLLSGGVIALVAGASSRIVRPRLADDALNLAAIVAVGATAGSLYLSEVANFIPCELCWFQRVAMYPLAILLPLASLRRDRSMLRYALVLAVAGLGVSAYHVQLQLFPAQSSMCDVSTPCTARWVEAFGWMTIPQMAAMSFALIIGVSTLALSEQRRESS